MTKEEALQKAAEKLDISPTKYQQAMNRFSSLKEYLIASDYDGTTNAPDIYLQGSFKLGTEIRPFKNSRDADYDIDMVCCLGHHKRQTAASTVKTQVGQHLNSNPRYSRLLDEEGKRCWTLNYAEEDGIGFHLDVLPSVEEEGYNAHHAIAATHKSEDNRYSWITSNPRGFAEWFYERNGIIFQQIKATQKRSIYSSQRAIFNSEDDVPDIHVKTPLQRAIQILKRHRDVRFAQTEIEDYKPISMIITVLTAQCYNNETTISGTLNSLITKLNQQSQQLSSSFKYNRDYALSTYSLITRTADGRWQINNPTNPGENFADRWHEDNNARAKAFFQWVDWLNTDILNIGHQLPDDHFVNYLLNASTRKPLPSVSFDVPHKQNLTFPVALTGAYSAQIRANYKTNVGWKRFESRQPLLKSKNLKFKLVTDVPAPYSVFWQVVNTGNEATSAGQLRGQVFNHTDTVSQEISHTETTSYTGDHWIEGFVVKDGYCVARTGEFVVSVRNSYA